MDNTDIKNLINTFLKENKLENGLLDLEVKKVWFEVMENGIANYTKDINLKNKTLYIKSKIFLYVLYSTEFICIVEVRSRD